MIWAESRCGQLWCDQSLPGCRPIVDLGLYEVIHWERDEHCVSKQNGTQESHIGAILLCGVISCYFHLSLSLTLCQWQFVFWLIHFTKAVLYEWGRANRPSSLISFFPSMAPSKNLGDGLGEGLATRYLLFFI